MPTYDYKCESCGHMMEAFQKITDPSLVTCPQCNKNTLRKLISGEAATLNFVGKGFYCNDYSGCSGNGCGSCGGCHSDS